MESNDGLSMGVKVAGPRLKQAAYNELCVSR